MVLEHMEFRIRPGEQAQFEEALERGPLSQDLVLAGAGTVFVASVNLPFCAFCAGRVRQWIQQAAARAGARMPSRKMPHN